MRDYHVLDEAKNELKQAVEWYEQRGPGLGHALKEEYERTVYEALSMPSAGSLLMTTADGTCFRRFPLRRFKHHVLVIAVEHETLTLVALMHTSRLPNYWTERLV